jgi:hypothetical protein
MSTSFKFAFLLSLFFALTTTNDVAAQTDGGELELNIFPNPNRGTFYITVINDANYSSELYSMDGRLVKSMHLQSGLNYYSVQVPAGIYMLKIGEGEAIEEFKIVIK